MEDCNLMTCLPESLLEHILGGPELREDDELVWEFAQQAQEPIRFGTLRLCGGPFRQIYQQHAFRPRQALMFGKTPQRSGRRLAGASQRHLQRQQRHAVEFAFPRSGLSLFGNAPGP